MSINAIISFLIELCTIAIYGYAPFLFLKDFPFAIKFALGFVAVAVFVLLWGYWAAPRSSRRLAGLRLTLFKISVFIPAIIVIFIHFGIVIGCASTFVLAINLTLEHNK